MKPLSFLIILSGICISVRAGDEKQSAAEKKKADLTGSLTFFNQAYHMNGITARREPFTWRLTGDPTLTVGDFRLPLHVIFGSYQEPLNQSFNKIGITPTYKWLKIHLGFSTVDFSKLVVSGKPFLGAGIELNPAFLRLGFIYGRLQKAVNPGTFTHNDSIILPHDTLITAPDIPQNFQSAFKRTGYAVKLGFGKKDRYVDLVYFKATDDTNSIHYAHYGTLIRKNENAEQDTVPLNLKPQENAAFGIVARGDFLHKVFLEIDGALSLYSRDILAKPYEEKDFAAANELKPFITVRKSTQVTGALLTKIEYRGKGMKIGFGYDRITPDYETMGIYYFQNDVQRFLLYSNWKMLKKRMLVSAKIGVENNNLLETLTTTSLRTLGMLNIFWMVSNKTSITFFYSNHQQSISDERGNNAATLKLGQAANVLNSSLQHNWSKDEKVHLFNFTGNYQTSRQHNELESEEPFHNFGFLPDYTITFTKSEVIVLAGFEYNQTVSDIHTAFYGPVVGATKLLAKKKLTLALRANISGISTDGAVSAVTTRVFFNFSYRVIGKHLIKLRMIYLNNSARNSMGITFTELQGDVSYTVQF